MFEPSERDRSLPNPHVSVYSVRLGTTTRCTTAVSRTYFENTDGPNVTLLVWYICHYQPFWFGTCLTYHTDIDVDHIGRYSIILDVQDHRTRQNEKLNTSGRTFQFFYLRFIVL